MKTLTGFLIVLSLTGAIFAQGAPTKSNKPVARPAATPAAPSGPVALRGGKLLTITHGVIENGIVVIENGKISARGGANTAVPRNARAIDCTGMTIYTSRFHSRSK